MSVKDLTDEEALAAAHREMRYRLTTEAEQRMGRFVLYMLAWDGKKVREPFKYELRQAGKPAQVIPFKWQGRA